MLQNIDFLFWIIQLFLECQLATYVDLSEISPKFWFFPLDNSDTYEFLLATYINY